MWINRSDILRDYSSIISSIPNDQLRDQLNNYFSKELDRIFRRDEEKKKARQSESSRSRKKKYTPPAGPTEKQESEAAIETIRQFPQLIDYYIRWKEDHGDLAEAQADERVRSSERLFIGQVREFAVKLLAETDFYRTPSNTLEEARARVMFMKTVIEDMDGHKLFYADGEPIRREADLHVLYRLTWFNSPSDVNREVNNGRGPVNFAISRGRSDKSLVEFKLAKNTSLQKNLASQLEIYKKAGQAKHGLKVIVFFTREEKARVEGILKSLGLGDNPDVILIDARGNKPSASKADSVDFDDE